ncbi:MAG TPA: SelB C-terminal domain-containing protein, partial [Thermoanaerobaculia bacterium]|nr:SelB C-terminal domain-containing protein [Thermoanaerobaculia bacterium]
IDRVSEDVVAVAELEIRELVAGSFLENAPILPVSAKTGAGVEKLADVLFSIAGAVASDRDRKPLRLPIDRAFSIPGFGAVVTGSLVDGTLTAGQKVEILPQGIEARVRRVEVHDEAVETARAGERTSANLAGVEREQLRRGQMIVAPGSIAASPRLLVRLTLLPDAPPVESGDELSFHHFASERVARVRLWAPIPAGGSGPALLTLDEPVAARVFDRFIVRRLSPAATIGGGEIVDARPPRKVEEEDRRVFLEGALADRVARRIARSTSGASREDLARDEGLKEEEIKPLLAPRLASGELKELDSGRFFLSKKRWDELAEKTAAAVGDEIKRRPGAVEASRAAVLEQVFPAFSEKDAEIVLRSIVDSGKIAASGESLKPPGGSSLPSGEQKLADRIQSIFDEAKLDPPSPGDVAAKLAAKPKIVEGLLAYLVKEKRLARLPGGFFISRAAVDRVIADLRASGKSPISVPEFKEMFGLTRRMAIPLLEHLDEKKVTRRAGDRRELVG